jgi:hypothetical protein
MNLNKKFISQALIIICIVTLPSILPLKAVSQSQGVFSREKEPGGGRSWEEIETVFLNKSSPFERPPRPAGSRSGNQGNTEFCPISPQGLVDPDPSHSESTVDSPIEIWSDRPLFIWQEDREKSQAVVVYSAQGSDRIWSQEVDPEDNFIVYNNETPLQAGATYQWNLLLLDSQFQQNFANITFKVMDADKRELISKELMAIEQQLEGESAEVIALEKANYFIEKGLWSDALQVMFLVDNPSPALQQAIDRIKSHNFCQTETDSTP